MLNRTIRIDLHIHSKASSYKESAGIVDNSDIDHIDVLLAALAENGIDMLSITDHNRFDAELYRALDARLHDDDCALSATLLAGVEFDVRFQDDRPAAHVIVIFNAQSGEDYDKIENAISRHLLTDASDCYTLTDFETVLKEVGLDTILIVHQHSGFGGNQRRRSLGAATDDAIALYKFGYIDALEYNSPKVQGILRSELADFELPQRMLIGSDCHQWSVYPKHDSTTGASVAFCARIRALPSFKGLLMALTSPETRMGVAEALMQPSYCPSLSLCGHSVELSPGINVIIGENGSGKTSILDLMCPDIKPKDWVKRTGRALSFSCAKKPDHVTYIQQGDLQERYHKGTLFDSTLYLTPVHTSFELAVRAYASEIKKRIRQNISVADARETARSAVFLIDPSKEQQTHSFQATIPEGFSSLGNPWRKAPETLHGISSEIEAETKKGEVYSSDEIAKLQAAQRLIDEVRASVKRRKEERAVEIAARSVVLNALKKYKNAVQKRSSDEDIERNAYQESRTKFIDAVIGLARAESLTPITPIPSLLDADAGSTTNQRQGFNFVRTAAYVGSPDYGSGLLEKFRVGYRTLESLCAINSAEGAAKSIPSGKAATWETDFDSLVDKYIAEMEVCSDTIIDGNKVATGNTMGERAITYFKYVSLNMDGSSVLVVDQPEDNISNQRISGALLDYLNDLRIRGQVILATHNPLLVVNLDADNVIAIKEDSQGRKSVSFGCLESDEDGDVLQDIADIMDGGKEAIRKRMRAYGSVY